MRVRGGDWVEPTIAARRREFDVLGEAELQVSIQDSGNEGQTRAAGRVPAPTQVRIQAKSHP